MKMILSRTARIVRIAHFVTTVIGASVLIVHSAALGYYIFLSLEDSLGIPLFGYATFSVTVSVAVTIFLWAPLIVGSWLNFFLRCLYAFILAVYFFCNIILAVFSVYRGLSFDLFYLWFNRKWALSAITLTIEYSYGVIVATLICIIVVAFSLVLMGGFFRLFHRARFGAYMFIIFCGVVAAHVSIATPILNLVKDALARNEQMLRNNYATAYRGSFVHSKAESLPAASATGEKPSIILLQLESLNSEFVTPGITPVLWDLSRDGVLFTKHHSNGLLSERADEVILCSALPSLHSLITLDDSYRKDRMPNQDVECLPATLRARGYKTLFFMNFNLAMHNSERYMPSLGFDEVHGPDLMAESDPQIPWGYREDVFFQRVADYITTNVKQDAPLFIHIVVGATNHAPFEVAEDTVRPDVYKNRPYPNASGYESKRANAAFIQDAYVEDFLRAFSEANLIDTSDVYVYGDHPIKVSKYSRPYSYFVSGVDEENYLTSLLFMPSSKRRETFALNRRILYDSGTSHQGLGPTILESLGLKHEKHHALSFFRELAEDKIFPALCSVNAQPFFKLEVGLTQYPHKVIVSYFGDRIDYVNLEEGGAFERRIILRNAADRDEDFLEACLSNKLGEIVEGYLKLRRPAPSPQAP